MWFDSWADLGRILAVGAAAYVTVVVVLRTSGKRTLAKLNAYDLVVTVALGSTLATILLSSDVSWADGAVALALLAGLQMLVAWVSVHWGGVRSVVTARPTLLFSEGRPLPEALREQRTTLDEVRQAVRAAGSGDLADIAAVVLETDGTLSVIPRSKIGDWSALERVAGAERGAAGDRAA
ncbi:DUF421 domain-containing protein [Modestobacter marinus]|uniref:DUF421 domain-containing protein n=1 Tax=Modestobacter marinus TaxID=477641 RepID=A0A846LZI1_9ACTN|nr:YetF domain-containing protein [Modestobacter marinus]NIH68839.1 uncharacterized membrane protein YcaP (DUF421 family) [Modestobacter marinus]GGL60417.1 DUF421 domain-containing protein [Modestobacter marinus]